MPNNPIADQLIVSLDPHGVIGIVTGGGDAEEAYRDVAIAQRVIQGERLGNRHDLIGGTGDDERRSVNIIGISDGRAGAEHVGAFRIHGRSAERIT